MSIHLPYSPARFTRTFMPGTVFTQAQTLWPGFADRDLKPANRLRQAMHFLLALLMLSSLGLSQPARADWVARQVPEASAASQAQINELYQRSYTLDWQPAPADICPFDAPHCLRRFGPQDRFALDNQGRLRDKDRALPPELINFYPAPGVAELESRVRTSFMQASRSQAYCVAGVYEGGLASGSAQYWNALVLILHSGPRTVAYRFDGFDANHCEQLRSNGQGLFLLPVLQVIYTPKSTAEIASTQATDSTNPRPPALGKFAHSHHSRLALFWHVCNMHGCQSWRDLRAVVPDDQGRLWDTEPAQPQFQRDQVPSEAP